MTRPRKEPAGVEIENAVERAGRRGKLAGTLVAGAVLALAAVPAASQAALTVPKPEARQITTPQPVQAPVQSMGGASPSTPGSALPATAAVPTPGAVVLKPTGNPSPPPASQQPPKTSIDCSNCTTPDAGWLYRQEIMQLEAEEWKAILATDKQRYEALKQEQHALEEHWAHDHGIRVDREALAEEAAARQQRAHDAAEYAEEHDDDYVQAMDEYFDEHNDELLAVPVAGGILQELLTPVFEAFKATPKTTAEAVPVGHSMPESPNGEPLAAVSIRTLLGPDDTNSSKF